LGAQLFSAIPDLGRVAARYGLANTSQRIAQFALSSEMRNMAKADMQRLGTALDVVLHTREHSLEGTGSMVDTGDKLNRFAQNATAKFTKYSMIAHWDASIRLISAQLEQDAIARLVKGDNVSAFEKAKLAAHGDAAHSAEDAEGEEAKKKAEEQHLGSLISASEKEFSRAGF
jgi:hypothetical protein